MVLGDDVVIADQGIALVYQRLMSELGVEISESKTHISENLYEFAKRWSYKGEEITPFPVPALIETWKRYYLLQNTIETARDRGYVLRGGSSDDTSVLDLYKRMGKGFQGTRVLKLFKIFDALVTRKLPDNDKTANLVNALLGGFKVIPKVREGMVNNPNNVKDLCTTLLMGCITGDTTSDETELDKLNYKLWSMGSKIPDFRYKWFTIHPLSALYQSVIDRRE